MNLLLPIQAVPDFVGLHPSLAIAAAFLVSVGEALPIVGLFSPSTVVLIGIGSLVGLGKVSFWPVFIATILGATIGDAISYWTPRIYKERLVGIWPVSRHHGLLTAKALYRSRRHEHRHRPFDQALVGANCVKAAGRPRPIKMGTMSAVLHSSVS